MNREQFIEACSTLTEQELHRIAEDSRRRVAGYITEEAKQQFRSLDDTTRVKEVYYQTAYGRTHLYIIRPVNETGMLPVIVNVHGGGWSMDHSERDIYFSRRLAIGSHALVIDVDYLLAPEYPYPAALEELEALFNELPQLAREYEGDIGNVVLCGQSAGGNLVAAVMERRRFRPLAGIKAQILCYMPTDNYNDHFHGEELDPRGEITEYYGFFYNRSMEERRNHDVSILMSSKEEVQDFPPTDIITAGKDNLLEEGEEYFRLLESAGVKTTYRCFEDSRHGFLVNLYDEWKEGEEYVLSRIREHLH